MGSVHLCRISWAPCTPAGFHGLRAPLPDFVGSVHPWLGTPNGWSLEFILSNNINSKPFAFQKFPNIPFVPKLHRFRQKVSTGACLICMTKGFVNSCVKRLVLWFQGVFEVQNDGTGQRHEETDNRRPNGQRGTKKFFLLRHGPDHQIPVRTTGSECTRKFDISHGPDYRIPVRTIRSESAKIWQILQNAPKLIPKSNFDHLWQKLKM